MTLYSSLYGERLSRELGNEDSTTLFTTTRRKAAINEAQSEFAELTECLQRRSTVTMVGGTGEYDLNSTGVIAAGDFLRWTDEGPQIRYTDASGNVTITEGDDLQRRDLPWLNKYESQWQTSTVTAGSMQLPTFWYDRIDGPSHFIGFAPIPSTGSSATMELILPYLAKPASMSADSDEPFTVNSSVRTDLRWVHQALVHFAAAQLEKYRRDMDASDRQLQRFVGYVQRYLAQSRRRTGNVLTQARNYFQRRGSDWRSQDPRR